MSDDNVFDDILFEESNGEEKIQTSHKKDLKGQDSAFDDEIKDDNVFSLPRLSEDSYPKHYQRVVDRFLMMYEGLPKLDYDAIYAEIADLNVDSSPTPTLQLINLKLQKIQASKDRIAEIYQKVIRCYTFKKRAVSILTDAWGRFSEGSSQDKRKADATYRLSEFHLDLANTESLYNACDHILRNLDSQSYAISRQITIIQHQLKMFDMGRGALPDFNFNKGSLDKAFESLGDCNSAEKDENIDYSEEIDETQSELAEELSFD